MRLSLKQNWIYITLIIAATLFTFWDITSVFYQQDEWHALGEYLTYSSIANLFKEFSIFSFLLGEGRPLSSIIGFLLMFNFPFNTVPLAIYSLIFHLLNAMLVYFLALSLIKNKIGSTIAAIFFVTCAVSSPTVFWFSTSIGTLPATALILVSVILFRKVLSGQASYLIWSFALLFLSQLFKEIGYFLFLILPLTSFIFQKPNLKNFVKTYWYYLATFLLIAFYRINQLNTYSVESSVFTQTSSHNFFLTIGIRTILYPFTSASLIFIPSDFLIKVAKIFTNQYYPFFPSEHYNLIVESAVLDLIAITLSFLLFIFVFLISTRAKRQIKQNTFLIIVLMVSSYLPYVILSKAYSYLDSRYYYLGAAFAGILFGLLITSTFNLFSNKLPKILLFLILFTYLFWQVQLTRSDLKSLADLSIERKKILNQIAQIKPRLAGKNAFYITGDHHYYLAQKNYVPFQQGVGYTILVWLNRNYPKFKELQVKETLWDLGSQGYFETGQDGFGYFWDKASFEKTIREKKLKPEEITALFYDSKSGKLLDISKDFIPEK